MRHRGSAHRNGLYWRVTVNLPTIAQVYTCAVQYLHTGAVATGNSCWQPTLATAHSPLDAGQTDVMIDRPIADFRDTERPLLSKNDYNIYIDS